MGKLPGILVVENHPEVAEIIKIAYLPLKVASKEVWLAPNAFQALRMLEEKKDFNLIICNIMLPDQSGIDLIRRIEKAGFNIPVIFISSFDDLLEEVRRKKLVSYRGGFRKPFERDEFIKAVEDALNR